MMDEYINGSGKENIQVKVESGSPFCKYLHIPTPSRGSYRGCLLYWNYLSRISFWIRKKKTVIVKSMCLVKHICQVYIVWSTRNVVKEDSESNTINRERGRRVVK